jgi:hypothetical protein
MVCRLLDRILCNGEENFWVKIAPLIVFGIIWLLSVIGKAAKSKEGKTQQQQPQPKPKSRQRQPDLDDFIKMVKNRYSEAKEQARKAQQREYTERTVSPVPPPVKLPDSRPKYRPAEKPIKPEPSMASASISHPDLVYSDIPPEMPEQLKEHIVETKVPELQTIPEMPEKIPMGGLTEEHPVEMTAIEHHIYEQPVHKPYLPELMEQLTNPDGLRKAFLYGEIFGKPIGLREI